MATHPFMSLKKECDWGEGYTIFWKVNIFAGCIGQVDLNPAQHVRDTLGMEIATSNTPPRIL